jgi:selenocysteine lyase/cysteine desulfurase
LALAFSQLHERGKALIERLWNGLQETNGVRVFGPTPDKARTPTIAFTMNGMSSTQVAKRLAERGLFLSDGDFYAMTVVERLGQAGVVRAGGACYTTEEEVERLLAAVRAL